MRIKRGKKEQKTVSVIKKTSKKWVRLLIKRKKTKGRAKKIDTYNIGYQIVKTEMSKLILFFIVGKKKHFKFATYFLKEENVY